MSKRLNLFRIVRNFSAAGRMKSRWFCAGIVACPIVALGPLPAHAELNAACSAAADGVARDCMKEHPGADLYCKREWQTKYEDCFAKLPKPATELRDKLRKS